MHKILYLKESISAMIKKFSPNYPQVRINVEGGKCSFICLIGQLKNAIDDPEVM